MFPIGVEALYPHAERNPGLVNPDVARAIYRVDGTLVAHGKGGEFTLAREYVLRGSGHLILA